MSAMVCRSEEVRPMKLTRRLSQKILQNGVSAKFNSLIEAAPANLAKSRLPGNFTAERTRPGPHDAR
jgi:hypothetical protein